MLIKWQGDTWAVRYYSTGYPRYVLERTGVSVSWLQNEENNFKTQEELRNCRCGAYKIALDGKIIKVADCPC